MALTFADPPIRVRRPDQLYPGGRPGFELVLRASGSPRLGAIKVRLLAIAGWQSERHVIDTTTTIVDDGPRRLSDGEHVVPLDLTLPDDLPPSLDAPPMWSLTRLLIEVARPRWFPARTTWVVDVGRPPREGDDGPGVGQVDGLTATVPAATLRAGTAFPLELALATPRTTALHVTGMLLPRGRVVRSGREVPQWLRSVIAVPTVAIEPGATTAVVRGYVPPSAAPSFATPAVGLDWRLRLLIGERASGRHDHVLDLPVTIVEGVPPVDVTALAPRGAAQLPEVWRSQAHRAGRLRRLFAVAAQALDVEVDHAGDPDGTWRVRLIDRRAPFRRTLEFRRDEEGTHFVADIDDLQLGLGLDVHEAVLVAGGGPGRGLTIAARDLAQASPIAQVARAVPTEGPLAGELRLDDRRLVLRLPPLPIDEARVVAIARELAALARQLADARERLAPPAEVTVERDAWQALASELGSVVRWGNLAIDGGRGAWRVALALTWADGRPHVAVRLAGHDVPRDPAVPPIARAPRGALDAADVPLAVRGLVAGWPADIDQLELRAGDVGARLRLPDEPRPRVPIDRVRDLIVALTAVLNALGPGAGPYR